VREVVVLGVGMHPFGRFLDKGLKDLAYVAVWDALFQQTGAIRVNNIEELLDTILAFIHLAPHRGRRVSVVGGGGAVSVTAADACERMGLSVPAFNGELKNKLAEILPPVGANTSNPVDVAIPTPSPGILSAVMETIFTFSDIDTLIIDGIEMYISNPWMRRIVRYQEELAQVPVEIKKRFRKPVVVVLPVEAVGTDDIEYESARRKVCDYYLSEKIPVFLTLERAAKALANLAGYYEYLNKLSPSA
jgi:acyl-CoA synthetase (NDP forming)